MATFHLSANIISRKKNQSVVASSAYRACEKIKDERLGEVFDYTRKKGLELSEIITPDNAPDCFKDRYVLWNEVEYIEKRKDAQLARNLTIALPCESSAEERKELLKNYVDENFTSKGMIADIAIHAPHREGDERNFHAHILLTTREITPEGFGKKNRDWNKKELLEEWRKNWSLSVNNFYQKKGIEQKVDHRSHDKRKEEAITKGNIEDVFSMSLKPQKDIGYKAFSMERRGIETDKGLENREIKERNQLAKDIWKEIKNKSKNIKQKFLDFIGEKNEPNKAQLMKELSNEKPKVSFNYEEKREKAVQKRIEELRVWVEKKEVKYPSDIKQAEERLLKRGKRKEYDYWGDNEESKEIKAEVLRGYKAEIILREKGKHIPFGARLPEEGIAICSELAKKEIEKKQQEEKLKPQQPIIDEKPKKIIRKYNKPELEEIRKRNIEKLQNNLKWHEEDKENKKRRLEQRRGNLEHLLEIAFKEPPTGYESVANILNNPEKYGKVKKGIFGIKKEAKNILEIYKRQDFGKTYDKLRNEYLEKDKAIEKVKEEIRQEENKPPAELQKQFDLQKEKKAEIEANEKEKKIEKMINALDESNIKGGLDDKTKELLTERLKADDKLFQTMEISYEKNKEKSRGMGLSL